MKHEGTMHYDYERERYMIAFVHSEKRPIWLHCGNCLDVFCDGQWIETSIEMTARGQWYLTDPHIRHGNMDGLRVRWYEGD